MTKQELMVALQTTGIPFAYDAWDKVDITKSYGVIDASSAPVSLWGDDQLIAQVWTVQVFLYSIGGKDEEMLAVQDILIDAAIPFRLTEREYLPDINAVRTTWSVELV